ncbi:MAG: phage integrase N-terminal SAM-like domain-containing protein, partial [Gemmatimonadota bacterium]
MAIDHLPQPKPGLLQRAQSIMAMRGYSLRTSAVYRNWIMRYIRFHGGRHPRAMGREEVLAFLSWLREERHVAGATQTQALSALLFLYRDVLDQPLPLAGRIPRARKAERLPVVLTPSEVAAVLGELRGVRRLVGLLLYGSGLRLMESLTLRVKDLDLERCEIVVRRGKGAKDRVTTLGASVVPVLRRHLEAMRR